MKKIKLGVIFFLIALFLTSCSKNKAIENVEDIHYIEEVITMLENLDYVNDFIITDNGNVLISGQDENSQQFLWKYNNESSQWNEDFNISDLVKNNMDITNKIISTQISSDGSILCILDSADRESKEPSIYFLIDNEKNIKELPNLSKIIVEKNINNLIPFNDENILATNFDGDNYIFNIQNDEIISSIQVGEEMVQSVTSDTDAITLLTMNGKVKKYDIKSGKEVEKNNKLFSKINEFLSENKSNLGNNGLIQFKDGFYLVNNKGINKITDSKITKLLNGKGTVLGSDNGYLHKVYKDNKDFLAWINENDKDIIYKFKYEDEKIVKDKKLSVYSLYENGNIEDMVNKFARENPNIDISYNIGISLDDNITETEAIKNLNTEILGNNSPDIIVLDGLNEQSYIKKNLLMDISPILNENKELISAATDIYSKDGRTYGIATKVGIPYFVQKGKNIDITEDADKIIEQIDNLENDDGIDKLVQSSRYNTASVLYKMSFSNESSIDDKILNDFYKLLVRVNKIELAGSIDEMGKAEKINELDTTVFSFISYDDVFNENSMYGFDYLTDLETFRKAIYLENLDINLHLLKKDGKLIYIPQSSVAISEKSSNKEIAEEFIKSIISKDYQSTDIYNGITTNLEAAFKIMNEMEVEELIGEKPKDEENIIRMEILTEEQKEKISNILKELKYPSVDDIGVKRIVLDEAQRVLDKKISVDDAVKNVSNKLKIYDAEK